MSNGQHDTHVRQRNFIKEGLVMFPRPSRYGTYVMSGNYRPTLCKAIMAKMPNAFKY